MPSAPEPQIDWSRPIAPVAKWVADLAASLGYPSEIPLEQHITDERRNWIQGDTGKDLGAWKFEIVGIPIRSLPEAPEERPDVFTFGYRVVPGSPMLWLRAISMRCHLPKAEVFVERTYWADGSYREDICGVNTCERDGIPFVRVMRDAERALAVLGAVFPQSRPGRPLATGYVTTPEDFRARIFPIIRKLADEGTKRPGQEQVCKLITSTWPEYQTTRATQESECKPRQLHRWFTENGWTNWKAVVDDALSAD